MDKLTSLFAILVALSLATERITETIKGVPVLSRWLAVERPSGSTEEELRKATIHVLAIGIGTILAHLTQGQLAAVIGLDYSGYLQDAFFGAMASGGSGLWNSTLDIVREVNKQKQVLTEKLKQ